MASARAEFAAEQQTAQLAADYHTGLRLFDAGRWEETVETLERVTRLDSTYQDAPALLERARRKLDQATALAEEQARRQAEAQARRQAEEQTRRQAEEQAPMRESHNASIPPGESRPGSIPSAASAAPYSGQHLADRSKSSDTQLRGPSLTARNRVAALIFVAWVVLTVLFAVLLAVSE